MVLLDGLEKLINEHGSATILKERISLANDKYAALEEKVEALRVKNDSLNSENNQLSLQVADLQSQLLELQQVQSLALKFGVYWDSSGNPFCPKCKTPMSQIGWATHVNQQVHGLKCTCTDEPFVLMEHGKPIHAQDAMRYMENS